MKITETRYFCDVCKEEMTPCEDTWKTLLVKRCLRVKKWTIGGKWEEIRICNKCQEVMAAERRKYKDYKPVYIDPWRRENG